MIPLKFIDGRSALPKHPTRTFTRRFATDIAGIVTHHTAMSDSPLKVAEYHIGPNHVCANGCPGALYTFLIWLKKGEGETSVEIWWANDLEAVTYSQGGGESPVPGTRSNTNFMAISLIGSFYSESNKEGGRPHIAQVAAWFALVGHLLGSSSVRDFPPELFGALRHVSWANMHGHLDFGKAACPGDDMAFLVKLARDSAGAEPRRPETVREWQRALVTAGYDLGPWGPKGDGVDGSWGATSVLRLGEFQAREGLQVTRVRDLATATKLAKFAT